MVIGSGRMQAPCRLRQDLFGNRIIRYQTGMFV